MNRITTAAMYASVREYLSELVESGVDGVPPELQKEQGTELVAAVKPVASGSAASTLQPHSSLEEVRQQLADCRRCSLSATRTNIVFGSGAAKARIMFIGEAPGADEDRQGEPFLGESGRILNRIIEAMGLERKDVYICNILKCLLPGNRSPHRDEVDSCVPYLIKQIKVVRPGVLVALGTFAAQTLLHSKEPISKLRGKFHDYNGIPLMPTFHPSFLQHHKNDKELYWNVWEDMEQVLIKLKLPVPEKRRKT